MRIRARISCKISSCREKHKYLLYTVYVLPYCIAELSLMRNYPYYIELPPIRVLFGRNKISNLCIRKLGGFPVCNVRSRGLFTFTEAKANGISDVFEDNVDRFLVAYGVGRHAGVLSPLVERGSRVGYTDRHIRAVFPSVARLVHQYFHRYGRFVRTEW